MEEDEEIPVRRKFWFKQKFQEPQSINIFDHITWVYLGVLAAFTFLVFWPVISQIKFEEAFYTPLPALLIYLFNLAGITPDDALRILFLLSLTISTIGIYLFTRELTKRQITPILAAIIYILPPLPVFVLTYFRRGLYQAELDSATSFFSIIYGESAHFLALAMIPFIGILYLKYLKTEKIINFLWTMFLICLVLLVNRSQSFNLFLILAVLTLTDFFLDQNPQKLKKFAVTTILSLGLVSFWYTPNFWLASIIEFKMLIVGNIQYLFPLPFVLIILGLFFSFVFFARKDNRQLIFISFLLFTIFSIVLASWFISGRSFLPHPQRLIPNLNMFGAIVLSLIVTQIIDKLNIVQIFKAERLNVHLRVILSLLFGLVSTTLLTLTAYLFSPYLILLVSGSSGIWTKVRLNVLADREANLKFAGGKFNLIERDASDWQVFVGITLTAIFLILLLYFVYSQKQKFLKSNENSR